MLATAAHWFGKAGSIDNMPPIRRRLALAMVFACSAPGTVLPADPNSDEINASRVVNRSTLGITAGVDVDDLRSMLRTHLNRGKPLTAPYQEAVALGHARVHARYTAHIPDLVLIRNARGDFELEVPVSVARVASKRTFVELDPLATMGYQLNGCKSLALTARAAVALRLENGELRLSASRPSRSGNLRKGGCTVTKKPVADVTQAVGKAAGWSAEKIGSWLGNDELTQKGKKVQRQLDALPDVVDVQRLVVSGADAEVRKAVQQGLEAGGDRLLDTAVRAQIMQGLNRGLNAASEVVSLELRPSELHLDDYSLHENRLLIKARVELEPVPGLTDAPILPDPGAGALSVSPGFLLPLEFVLPVRELADPPDRSERLFPLPAGGQAIGLATVPRERALVRVRLHQAGAAPRLLIYLSAGRSSASVMGREAATGDLDDMLSEVVDWLRSPDGLPRSAQANARSLGDYFETFRDSMRMVLTQLSHLRIDQDLVLEVSEPSLRIFDGRYADGLIRLPVHLIGSASLDVTYRQ